MKRRLGADPLFCGEFLWVPVVDNLCSGGNNTERGF